MELKKPPAPDPLVAELIAARKRLGLTQTALAELSGVSRRAIAGMEVGGDVTLGTLRKLCDALEVEIHVQGAAAETAGRRPTLDDVVAEQRRERFGRERE